MQRRVQAKGRPSNIPMRDVVYLLWFKREGLEEADILVGVYSSQEQAEAAIQRLKKKPGFADFPRGFETAYYELDHDYWEEGFKFVD